MAKKKESREDIIARLESAEMEEGRSGLVVKYLAENPEPTKTPKKEKKKK